MTPSFVSSRLMQKSSIGKTLIAVSMSLMLTACGNLSGLQDASSDFACSVDMPARCQSLSTVHESINRHETQDSIDMTKSSETSSGNQTEVVIEAGQTVTTVGQVPDRLTLDTPLMLPKRAAEEILRIWIAPYIDESGDLHAEHVIFATVRASRWAPETLAVRPQESQSRMFEPLADKPSAKGSR